MRGIIVFGERFCNSLMYFSILVRHPCLNGFPRTKVAKNWVAVMSSICHHIIPGAWKFKYSYE